MRIPERDAPATGVIPSTDEGSQALCVVPGLAESKSPGATEDARTAAGGAAADQHDAERAASKEHDTAELTGAGCFLTLLSVGVIFGVALPVVRWRDPTTGLRLPRDVAIFSIVLIGAAFNGLGVLFLRLIGLRVWKKREKDGER
jgi:hypothetical protein